MTPKHWIGVGLLLIACEVVGIFAGNAFYGLFLKSVPPMSMSELSVGAAHGLFLGYGAVLGVVMAAIALVSIGLSRFFRAPRHAA